MSPAPSPKVSVIIPVYNVEKYIRKCLDSIFNQTLPPEQLEVICVDDGSTDGTPAILDSYAADHSNLTVLTQKNGGSSVARNRGIEIAKGEYIYFVDSDDWLSRPDALALLYERAAKLDLDVLFFNANVVYENDSLFDPSFSRLCQFQRHYDNNRIWQGQELYAELRSIYDFSVALWRHLYRRSFLMNNQLRFVPGILHQDQVFAPECTGLAKRVACYDLCCYNYLVREGSITANKANSIKESVYSRLVGAQHMERFAEEHFSKADSKFNQAYWSFVKNWRRHNAEAYCKLTRKQRKALWKKFSAENRALFKRQMDEEIRKIRHAEFKRRIHRYIPKRWRTKIKALIGRKS